MNPSLDRKSTRLNSSHRCISYAVFCLKNKRRLSVAVLDENGVAVRGARVTLQLPSPAQALRCETEISGRCELSHIPSGPCQIHVEKEGYYFFNSSVEPSADS